MNAFRSAVLLVLALSATAVAQTKERKDIDPQQTWNLTDLYPSDAAWREAKTALVAKIPTLEKHRGKVGKSAASLNAALTAAYDLRKDLNRLATYASLAADQDTRVSQYQAMRQEVNQVGSAFGAAISFLEPEILAIPKARLEGFLQREPELRVYTFYLKDLNRRRAHKLSPGEEKIIADAGLISDSAQDIATIFGNADFPFPSVTLSDGKTVKLDKTTFQLLRQSTNREDRKRVFAAFFGALGGYKNTFGTALNANLNRDLFYMKARKYPSTMAAALDADNIPLTVYSSLVSGVNEALPAFHRYLKLRGRMLNLDQVHYYDLYAPLVGSVNLEFPVETAKALTLEAVKPLGTEYGQALQLAYANRWIDMYPNVGKRSGAYMSGSAYDVHPYVLMNYNGKYEDLTTLIHEMGHAMQSYLSNKTQPYPIADYPIFVAEVASTFNEALLVEHMLKSITDDTQRLALLGSYLEGLRTTVFRQAQFAEFEARIHELAEKGQPLTGETLGKEYLALTRKYYGHDQGVAVVDDYVAHEWAFVPHFYYNYYVYQYATSFTASVALSEKVLAGDKVATEKYLQFLSAGGSDYPIELLKRAGVDMTTAEPMRLTVQKMNRVMDEMDRLLAKAKPAAPPPAKK